jgi:hypothetical protein
LHPTATTFSSPDHIELSFDGSPSCQAGVWEIAFGGQRVLADFARLANASTIVLTAKPPAVPSPRLTVDVKVLLNSKTLHVSPQALVYYGPYALDRAILQSNTSFLIEGRNLPVVSKPTAALRVSFLSTLSPRLFSLVVEDYDNQTVLIL